MDYIHALFPVLLILVVAGAIGLAIYIGHLDHEANTMCRTVCIERGHDSGSREANVCMCTDHKYTVVPIPREEDTQQCAASTCD